MSACSKGLRDSPNFASGGLRAHLKLQTEVRAFLADNRRFISKQASSFSGTVSAYTANAAKFTSKISLLKLEHWPNAAVGTDISLVWGKLQSGMADRWFA